MLEVHMVNGENVVDLTVHHDPVFSRGDNRGGGTPTERKVSSGIVYSCSGFLRFRVRLPTDRSMADIKSSPGIQMIADSVCNSDVFLYGYTFVK